MSLPYDYVDAKLHERRERVFLVLAGIFLGSLAMLNVLGISRFLHLAFMFDNWESWDYRFAIAVGVLPYPITFLCTDFISELYGRRRANFVVFVGLLLNIWVVFILWLSGVWPGFAEMDAVTGQPPLPTWDASEKKFSDPGNWAFFQIRSLAFGAVAASMIAYLAAQFVDVQVFHFWKWLTKGKHLWLRNNGSTLVSQLVDTTAVILITHYFAGGLPMPEGTPVWAQLLMYIATGYVFKMLVALLDTIPFYIGTHYLGRYLQIDPRRQHRGWDT